MQMPVVSAEECVRVLSQLGFQVLSIHHASVSMVRDREVVEVPRGGALDDESLWSILRAAHISQVEFLDALGLVSMVKIPVARAS